MATNVSGIYLHTVEQMMKGTTITGGFNIAAATNKIAFANTTQADAAGLNVFSMASPIWAAGTVEQVITGATPSYTTGGNTLTQLGVTATFAQGTAGSLRYAWSGNAVWTNASASGSIEGCWIYSDPSTAPADMVDAMICYVDFTGTNQPTNGTLTIQWSGTGIFEIDLTP